MIMFAMEKDGVFVNVMVICEMAVVVDCKYEPSQLCEERQDHVRMHALSWRYLGHFSCLYFSPFFQ